MDTMNELEYYCRKKRPVGALLLSGEWGSGKTYYIENILKKELFDEFVFVRISLFGLTSIDELNKSLKKAYINETEDLLNNTTDLMKFRPFFEKIIKLIPNDAAKTVLESVLTVDFFDFVKIKNTIDNKKIILVFDDFERSQLDIHEKLGVINEYCENQHFNVIVVADENKIKKEEYKDFKEKTIEKTIKFTPDYPAIVENVINDFEDGDYKSQLLKKKENIAALFDGKHVGGNCSGYYPYSPTHNGDSASSQLVNEEADHGKHLDQSKPHNIRSLKFAICEFERIYEILIKNDASDIDKWFYSFLTYILASKANLINKYEKKDNPNKVNIVAELYPGFYDSKYMPDCIKQWVDHGVWTDGQFEEYIDVLSDANKAKTPKDKVKNCRIDLLDENIAIQGFKEVLDDAYNGSLTMEQYVFLVINSYLVHHYRLEDLNIDWDRVQSGIQKRKDICIQNGIKQDFVIQHISNLEGLTDDEKKTYKLIEDIVDNSLIMYGTNKKQYIQAMHNSPNEAFMKVYNLSFNCFDNDMADATLDAFKSLDNADKATFSSYFKGMWKNLSNSLSIGQDEIEKSIRGFNYLKYKLDQLKAEYQEFPFKKRFTQNFIDIIDELIEQYSKTIDI